jgi:hypothetical protein
VAGTTGNASAPLNRCRAVVESCRGGLIRITFLMFQRMMLIQKKTVILSSQKYFSPFFHTSGENTV